ncbi:MAG: DUF4177 domain-containing protein [Clostridium sp.]
MYEYKYVNSKGGTWYTEPNHREIIDKYALMGWRFVAAIPTYQTQEGKVKELDLVFERKI